MFPKTPDKHKAERGKDAQEGGEQVLKRQGMETVHPKPEKRYHPEQMRPDEAAQTEVNGQIESASRLFGALIRAEKLGQGSQHEEKSERGRTKREDIRIGTDKKQEEEEWQQCFSSDDDERKIDSLYNKSKQTDERASDQVRKTFIGQHGTDRLPDRRDARIASDRIAGRVLIPNRPTYQTDQYGKDKVRQARQIDPLSAPGDFGFSYHGPEVTDRTRCRGGNTSFRNRWLPLRQTISSRPLLSCCRTS